MNEVRGLRRTSALNRGAGRRRPTVTFIAFPPHEQATDRRPENGGLAAVSRLPVRPATESTVDATSAAGADGRPRSVGRPPSPAHRRPRRRVREVLRYAWRRLAGRARRSFGGAADQGMSTAEYAIGTVAACGFAALLYKVVTSGSVTAALSELVDRALHAV
ncbi:DUF4244 domain-containing protein [Kitasatospora kifunensis]